MHKPSRAAKFTNQILKLINFKRIIEKQIDKGVKTSKAPFIPKGLNKSFQVDETTINEHQTATFYIEKKDSQKHFIFLHGGAYVFNANAGHWYLAKSIAKGSNAKVSMLNYPLAPEHSYKNTYAFLFKTYDALIAKYPNNEIILLGDSAGAGLALGFCQKLVEQGYGRLPQKMVLLSPWLNLAMTNPKAQAQEKTDHVLSFKMLQTAAYQYAASDDMSQPMLSPINGRLGGLPSTLVVYSNHELFFADCEKLKELTQDENGQFQFKCYQGLPHDWAVLPLPDRKLVIEDILDFTR